MQMSGGQMLVRRSGMKAPSMSNYKRTVRQTIKAYMT